MVGTLKTPDPVEIIVYEEDEVFWVQKGKRSYAVLAYDYEGAMKTAHRLMSEKGGKGKAVVIDFMTPMKEAAQP